MESDSPVVRPVVNALSVDVEEYYHALIFQEEARGVPHGSLESRVEASVERVLALFDRSDVRATFFTVGVVGAAHPVMVRKIAGAGHEIACHGHHHKPVWDQTPAEFRADIHDAKALLEDVTGERVIGYRAPTFSIGPRQAWAYDLLLEEGFTYDSSVYPILHDLYGLPGAPRFPYEVRRNGDHRLIEFPIGTVRLLGVNFPIGGGGYFRLMPLPLTRWGIRHVNGREGRPVMFYFHPWELDPDQPRAPMRWHRRFRHYVGLARQEAKLARLFQHVRFGAARDVLGSSVSAEGVPGAA